MTLITYNASSTKEQCTKFKVIDGGDTICFDRSHDVITYFITSGYGLPPLDENGNVWQASVLNFKEYQEKESL